MPQGNGCIAMTDKAKGKDEPRKGSTGSKNADQDTTTHEVVLEDGGEVVTIPGTAPLLQIVVHGRTYTHVSEDDEGRWVYRAV